MERRSAVFYRIDDNLRVITMCQRHCSLVHIGMRNFVAKIIVCATDTARNGVCAQSERGLRRIIGAQAAQWVMHVREESKLYL